MKMDNSLDDLFFLWSCFALPEERLLKITNYGLHGLCHVLDPAEHAEQTFMHSFSKHLEKHNNDDKL